MKSFSHILIFIAIILASVTEVRAEWKPDPLYWPTERTVVDISDHAAKWCKGAWGCIHRNATYYEWDYHLTGSKRPSECVIIVDAQLPADLRERVIEHEACHCKGFTHDSATIDFEPCPK